MATVVIGPRFPVSLERVARVRESGCWSIVSHNPLTMGFMHAGQPREISIFAMVPIEPATDLPDKVAAAIEDGKMRVRERESDELN